MSQQLRTRLRRPTYARWRLDSVPSDRRLPGAPQCPCGLPPSPSRSLSRPAAFRTPSDRRHRPSPPAKERAPPSSTTSPTLLISRATRSRAQCAAPISNALRSRRQVRYRLSHSRVQRRRLHVQAKARRDVGAGERSDVADGGRGVHQLGRACRGRADASGVGPSDAA